MNFHFIPILIIILLFLIPIILLRIDLKTDYSNQEIHYYFRATNNGFCINVPYFIWQKNKQKVIEQLFSEIVVYEGKTYIVTSIFKNTQHINNGNELLPNFIYRDYFATVALKPSSENTTTNINQIIGNNNTINNNTTLTQQNIYNITSNIDSLLQTNISDIDKQCLELFKLKLHQNNITESDKNRVLSVLEKLTKYSPYASLASSIINLIKSLLP
ncbi:MAG: hypothetical protein UDD07_09195 [Lachnospiraceae bacterium]|nr:hypothetical protein [Lachnospiraceae bacterium]